MVSYPYIAGFLDADGNISLEKSSSGDRPCYGVRVTFTNCNKKILEKIQQKIGGKLSLKKTKTGWRDCYLLRLRANESREFLPDIIEYLKIKKDRALLALDFLNEFTNGGRRKVRTDEDLAKQKEWYLKFKELNKRGQDVTD